MNATTTRANPGADLPPAQLPAKALQAFLIIADLAPEPVTWEYLALRIWPKYSDADKRKAENLHTLIGRIREALGPKSVIGGYVGGWSLGTPTARPVSTFGPGQGVLRGPEVPNIATVDGPLPDTAAALMRAQEWAQSQRPSARRVATP